MAIWKYPLNIREIPVGGFRGLDESTPPTARPLGSLSSVSNLIVYPQPSLATAPGLTAQGSALAATVSRGVFQYKNLAGTTVQTLAQAGCVLKRWDGATWQSIDAGTVASVTVTAGGAGYGTPPTVAFTGGGGTGAAGTAVLALGVVVSVTITNAGTGYITTPTVTFSGGGGAGATGTAVMTCPDVPMRGANLNDLGCLFWSGHAPRKWNGSTLAALSGIPPQGEFVVEAYDQLFVGGIPTREGDIDWCDVGDPETWSPAPTNEAGSKTVSTSPVKWVGFDRIQGKVCYWTTNEIGIINGPETENRSTLWATRTIAPYGTPNGRTVQNLNGTWMWLTNNAEKTGFAMWGGGSVEVAYLPIATSLALIDWTNIANASSWIDEKGHYCCSVPKSGGTLLFRYDPVTNMWLTGATRDIRVAGTITVSSKDYFLLGNEVGQMYRATGTDNAGTAIVWSLEVGPSTLGDPFHDKQILEAVVIMSAASGATVSASFSTTESGSYGTSETLTIGTGLTKQRFPVPIAAGDPVKSDVFRLKLNGTGSVVVHDVLLRIYGSGT